MTDCVRHARGTLTVAEIQAEIEIFWRDARSDAGLAAEARELGVDVTDSSRSPDVLRVEAEGAGVDPAVALILVSLGVRRVSADLWKYLVLPRIRRRWGDDAIGEEVPGGERER